VKMKNNKNNLEEKSGHCKTENNKLNQKKT
jgi:hypothetical protein